MARQRKSRLYQKRGRWYGDFRDLGGGQEALRVPGERSATEDLDVASALLAKRVSQLTKAKEEAEQAAKDGVLGIQRTARVGLAAYAARHLMLKAKDGDGTPAWLSQAEVHLTEAVSYFGAGADLSTLTPAHMTAYVEHLRQKENGRGGTLGDTSVRKYLNSVSNLFKRAVSEGVAPSNPVGDMFKRPTETRVEAEYLEPHEAALLLESARTYRALPAAQGHGGAISAKPNPWLYPILATYLLTGCRKSEVLGLEVDDVSFRLGKIYVRPNRWRGLKTKGSKRSVPIWPQLESILREYMADRERTGGLGALLFPSHRLEEEGMIHDLRKSLGTVAERAGFPAGHVHLHMLRHTYTAARIQTLDRGAPVALYTVARELGHASTGMIEDRYGHLHDRAVEGGAEVVEFRVETWAERIGERLAALGTGGRP